MLYAIKKKGTIDISQSKMLLLKLIFSMKKLNGIRSSSTLWFVIITESQEEKKEPLQTANRFSVTNTRGISGRMAL